MDRLKSGNVFILVCREDKVWLWIGSDANADERAKGSEVETVDFWGYLPGKVTANPNERGIVREGQATSIPGRRDRPCGRHGPPRQGAGVYELILINYSKNYS